MTAAKTCHCMIAVSIVSMMASWVFQVEFVEEVIEGEVLVDSFSTPDDNGDGLWNVSTPTEGPSSYCIVVFLHIITRVRSYLKKGGRTPQPWGGTATVMKQIELDM